MNRPGVAANTDSTKLRMLSTSTNGKWVDLLKEKSNDSGQPFAGELDRMLTDILLSQNLIVLCGLGTSLCLANGDKKLAPTMGDLWNEAKQIAGDNLEAIKKKVKYSSEEGENIEILLSKCLLLLDLEEDKMVKSFVSSTQKKIVERCRFVKQETELRIHETFIRKVARRSARKPRMQLFTTNYDLCFEMAASHTRFIVVDGFSHTHPQEFDGTNFGYDFVRRDLGRDTPDYLSNVFHLYKIHGSVDWGRQGNQIIRDSMTLEPLLIFPQRGKYESSYEQPFIEMMARFQIALRQENTGLLVIGFGFNDNHITQPILSAIRSNVSLRMAVVDPEAEKEDKDAYKEITSLISAGDSRLALLSTGFELLVNLIPDLVAKTEEERHFERTRNNGGRK